MDAVYIAKIVWSVGVERQRKWKCALGLYTYQSMTRRQDKDCNCKDRRLKVVWWSFAVSEKSWCTQFLYILTNRGCSNLNIRTEKVDDYMDEISLAKTVCWSGASAYGGVVEGQRM